MLEHTKVFRLVAIGLLATDLSCASAWEKAFQVKDDCENGSQQSCHDLEAACGDGHGKGDDVVAACHYLSYLPPPTSAEGAANWYDDHCPGKPYAEAMCDDSYIQMWGSQDCDNTQAYCYLLGDLGATRAKQGDKRGNTYLRRACAKGEARSCWKLVDVLRGTESPNAPNNNLLQQQEEWAAEIACRAADSHWLEWEQVYVAFTPAKESFNMREVLDAMAKGCEFASQSYSRGRGVQVDNDKAAAFLNRSQQLLALNEKAASELSDEMDERHEEGEAKRRERRSNRNDSDSLFRAAIEGLQKGMETSAAINQNLNTAQQNINQTVQQSYDAAAARRKAEAAPTLLVGHENPPTRDSSGSSAPSPGTSSTPSSASSNGCPAGEVPTCWHRCETRAEAAQIAQCPAE